MRTIQYEFTFSIIAFTILALVLIHSRTIGRMEDYNNRLFRKMIVISMLDVAADFLSTLVPALAALHAPALYMAINAVYNLLNVVLCYFIFLYTDSLRDAQREFPKALKRAMLLPILLAVLVLSANFPTHIMFYYDADGLHYSGNFGQFTYVMAALYIFASIVIILIHRREYTDRCCRFMFSTFGLIAVCIALQFLFPSYLTIDLGIALAILSFYLHNSNPTQYLDRSTGALDRSYFDAWIGDQIRMEKRVYLIVVQVRNLSSLVTLRGEKAASQIMQDLAQTVRNFDHEKTVFRLSGSRLSVHCHDRETYRHELEELTAWLHAPNSFMDESGCTLCLFGIPEAQTVLPQFPVTLYLDYLSDRMDETNGCLCMESSDGTVAGFRYELEMERYITEAMEKDLFALAYQPIYHLKEGRYVSVEVLTRLSHPAFGNLNPQKVINMAERCGSINALTRLQFRNLCSFLKEHPALVDQLESFKFNLSPLSLLDCANVQELVRMIEESGLPCSKFDFEFTESFATVQNDELDNIIALCREKHIRLSLDDFGSGFSNLGSVLQIPFTNIKLDRSLLLEVSRSPKMAAFYEGIVHLMQNHGLRIICEGVETENEKNLLSRWGADMIQGYYYSKPLPEQQLLEFLGL